MKQMYSEDISEVVKKAIESIKNNLEEFGEVISEDTEDEISDLIWDKLDLELCLNYKNHN